MSFTTIRRTRARAIVALTAIAALGTACGSVGSEATETKSTGAKIDVGSGELEPNEAKRIAMILNYDLSADYTVALTDAAKKVAEENGIQLDLLFDKLDAPTELSNYQSVMTSGKYQGLIIQPLTSQLCDLIADESVEKKMSISIVVTPLCTDDPSAEGYPWAPGTLSFVGGMNDHEHAEALAASAAENSPGPQKVLMVVGTQTLPDTVELLDGVDAYIKTNPDWEIVDTVNTDFSSADALAKTQNALQGNSDVTMIISAYSGITDGVVEAVEAQGKTGDIAVYDIQGGTEESAALIENGQLSGTLPGYPASMGAAAVQAIIDAGEGKTPERFINDDGNPDAAQGAITAANLDTLTPQY